MSLQRIIVKDILDIYEKIQSIGVDVLQSHLNLYSKESDDQKKQLQQQINRESVIESSQNQTNFAEQHILQLYQSIFHFYDQLQSFLSSQDQTKINQQQSLFILDDQKIQYSIQPECDIPNPKMLILDEDSNHNDMNDQKVKLQHNQHSLQHEISYGSKLNTFKTHIQRKDISQDYKREDYNQKIEKQEDEQQIFQINKKIEKYHESPVIIIIEEEEGEEKEDCQYDNQIFIDPQSNSRKEDIQNQPDQQSNNQQLYDTIQLEKQAEQREGLIIQQQRQSIEDEYQILATRVYLGCYSVEFEVKKRKQPQTIYFYKIQNDNIAISDSFSYLHTENLITKESMQLITIKCLTILSKYQISLYTLNCVQGIQELILKKILSPCEINNQLSVERRKKDQNSSLIDSLIHENNIKCMKINLITEDDLSKQYFLARQQLSDCEIEIPFIPQNQCIYEQTIDNQRNNNQKSIIKGKIEDEQEDEYLDEDPLKHQSPEEQYKLKSMSEVYDFIYNHIPIPSHNPIYCQIAQPRTTFCKEEKSNYRQSQGTFSSSTQSSLQCSPDQQANYRNYKNEQYAYHHPERQRNRSNYKNKRRYNKYDEW